MNEFKKNMGNLKTLQNFTIFSIITFVLDIYILVMFAFTHLDSYFRYKTFLGSGYWIECGYFCWLIGLISFSYPIYIALRFILQIIKYSMILRPKSIRAFLFSEHQVSLKSIEFSTIILVLIKDLIMVFGGVLLIFNPHYVGLMILIVLLVYVVISILIVSLTLVAGIDLRRKYMDQFKSSKEIKRSTLYLYLSIISKMIITLILIVLIVAGLSGELDAIGSTIVIRLFAGTTLLSLTLPIVYYWIMMIVIGSMFLLTTLGEILISAILFKMRKKHIVN